MKPAPRRARRLLVAPRPAASATSPEVRVTAAAQDDPAARQRVIDVWRRVFTRLGLAR